MNFLPRCLAIVLLSTGALAASAAEPMAMGRYGESYVGPKTLSVELAANAKGDRALIKAYGINHPWDGKVMLTDVRKDAYGRIDYVLKQAPGKEIVVMQSSPDRGHLLSLPGEGNLPLTFDREAARQVMPLHLRTDYEKADGAVK
jgi:hypothetical protein